MTTSERPENSPSGEPARPGEKLVSSGADPDAGLSAAWRARFALFDKAGGWDGQKLRNPKVLTFRETIRVTFNIPAFFFGVFYYWYLGLWKKGLVIFAVLTCIGCVLDLFSVPFSAQAGSFPVVFAALANRDYYLLKRHGETLWPVLRLLQPVSRLLPATLLPVALMIGVATWAGVEQEFSCSSETVAAAVSGLLAERTGLPARRLHPAVIEKSMEVEPGTLVCVARVPALAGSGSGTIQYEVRRGERFGLYIISLRETPLFYRVLQPVSEEPFGI